MIYLSALRVEVYLCAAERRCIVVEIRGSGAEGGNVEGAPWLLRSADNSSHLTRLLCRRSFIQTPLNPRVLVVVVGGADRGAANECPVSGAGPVAMAFLVKSAGFAASRIPAGTVSAAFVMNRSRHREPLLSA